MMAKGKRNEVRLKAGEPVAHSGPGLRDEPTLPPTADRKPAACPAISQPKSGREREGSALAVSGGAADGHLLTTAELMELVELFQLLSRWDREAITNA